MSHHVLDARRLLCPMPVIRVQDKIKTLTPGDVLAVTCTDPGAASDVPAWCRVHGHEVVNIAQRERELVITVKVL